MDDIKRMLFVPAWRLLIERSHWAWLLLLAGALTVYVLTLAPGAVGGDPGELQFVPYILSIPHPTGTPLYILLGKVWSMLPLGPTVAWRMNLLAAVSAALAVVMVYRCVYELCLYGHCSAECARPSPVPALAAALSLAFGVTFWEQALLADKYAFNALMVSLVIYLTLRWGRTRSSGTLHLLALTYGLSLAHHRTMALFAPTLLGYVVVNLVRADDEGHRSKVVHVLWRDRRRLLRLALLCLAPALLYLYLPWAESRGLPPGTWHPRTAREWYDYLFDTGRTGLVYVDSNDLGEMLLFYARTLLRDFTWVGVLLGVGGLVWMFYPPMFCRRWPDALFLLVNYVLQAFLAANHHVPRHWVYFIPSFLIYALWVGEGLTGVWLGFERLHGRVVGHAAGGTSRVAYRAAAILLALAMLVWPLLPFGGRYRPLRQAHLGAGILDPWRQTLKGGHMGDRVGAAIASVEPNAAILCDWEQATPLWYYQQVEGLRADVQIVYPIERLDEVAASGRPLYVARAQGGLADRWHPSCSESLIALRPEPAFDLPAETIPLGIRLGRAEEGLPVLELVGFNYGQTAPTGRSKGDAASGAFRPSTVVPLTLHWRAIEAPAHDYSVSLRLFDGAGEQVFQVDSQHPVLGTYPTSRWAAGEVVSDYYEIQLPADAPPGTYRWAAILYRALPEGGWESLRVADTDAEMAMGATFEVRAR
jgi:hypothetical protein